MDMHGWEAFGHRMTGLRTCISLIGDTCCCTMADNDLRRELGFWDALTIGAGTMIGAGIFLLAGVALELTGPATIFSYLAAGIVCMVTAASAAELATGMPTSGGDYDFVIICASREWSLRQVLFCSIPDVVADRADCSVLMVRRYVPDTLSVRAVEGMKRLKESVGLTTSPEA